jgi:hypothetical protein
MKKLSVWMTVLALFLAIPALAADRVIYNGIDPWQTTADGSTCVDFASTPIPAGFFCAKSEPFSGRIALRGVPIVTNTPGALKGVDTIVQRLDDAAFNKKGIAFTRLQMRVLNLESIAPVKTACGLFKARVTLDGEQPVTRMKIVRESAQGGQFRAPLAVNAKISFTPVNRPDAEPLELRKKVRFPAIDQIWQTPLAPTKLEGFLLVDTDGDRTPDTYLPGTSNFGRNYSKGSNQVDCNGFYMYPVTMECHDADGCQHCVCYLW